jgi:CheY-like chemotaxis protein
MLQAKGDSLHFSDSVRRDSIGSLSLANSSKEPKTRRPRILVVDDERVIADTVAEILEGAGFQAATAYDGWNALQVAGVLQPDYLLSDVLMPMMNGVDLAMAIRKMYPAARILLFSGQAGITEILRAAQDQGFYFELIPKPIHPLSLIARLKEL